MMIEFLSIIIFTFALCLTLLGIVTWWIERKHRKYFGVAMVISGLLVAAGYAFLGSRFALDVFGRLIVTIDLPRLMMTAILYTVGVLVGAGLAGGLFLWISQRFIRPTRLERRIAAFFALVMFIALLISVIAVQISR